jgi:hypothetical protein
MTAPFTMPGAVRRSGADSNGQMPRAYNGGLRCKQSLIGAVGAVAQWSGDGNEYMSR